MKIGIAASMLKNQVSDSFLAELFKYFVKFKPITVVIKNKLSNWDEKNFITSLKKNKYNWHSVNDNDGNIFVAGLTDLDDSFYSIRIVQDSDLFSLSDLDFERFFSQVNGLISCYVFDAEYVSIQSEIFEINLERKDFPDYLLETIRNTPFSIGVFNKKEYDIRFNPGRLMRLNTTWLLASWKMWFGEKFFELVSQKKLLSFPYASAVSTLPDGRVFILLFDKIDESHTVDSRFRQWKWQEWLNFDELGKKYG